MRTIIYGLLAITAGLINFNCHTSKSRSMSSTILNENHQARLISRQFIFTEGPATDKEGNVFFTDQPNNSIWKYSIDGQLSLFKKDTGRANGLYFDREGNLIACADEKNELWSISPAGEIKVLLKDFHGQRFNGPNDVWVHPSGGMYFTDPRYEREYWKLTTPQLEQENVYYLPKGAAEAVEVITDLVKPNGIIGTEDGKWLFVADIEGNKTFKYAVKEDGSLGKGELFVEQGSDGMTLDKEGNLYLTGKGVTVYDPNGKLIRNIPVPEDWTGNVTFMGRNRDKLFITASKGIYIVE